MHNLPTNRNPLSRLVTAGLFAALAVALNYALIAVPQVKLFNLVIFTAGFLGGAYAGALSGGVAAAAYSIFNPYNLGMFPPLPLLFAQVLCMALVGASGGLCKRLGWLAGGKYFVATKAAAIGLVLSLIYNVVVTASGAYLFGTFKEAFALAVPAMLINVVVNIVVFAILCPLLLPLGNRFGRDKS